MNASLSFYQLEVEDACKLANHAITCGFQRCPMSSICGLSCMWFFLQCCHVAGLAIGSTVAGIAVGSTAQPAFCAALKVQTSLLMLLTAALCTAQKP